MSRKKIFITIFLIIIFLPLIQMNLKIIKEEQLYGVETNVDKLEYNLNHWTSRKYQSNFENWFKQNIGFRGHIIKTNNQLLFDMFGKASDNLVIGDKDQMFEEVYIYDKYLGSNDKPNLEILIKKLMRLQGYLYEDNKTLIVNISPSKAEIYSEYVPLVYEKNSHKEYTNYDIFKKLANEYEINYVDNHETLSQIKKELDIELFPKGGTHWNELGALYGTKALIDEVEKLTGKNLLKLELINYEIKKPIGQDVDLASLLNVWKGSKNYYVPIIDTKVENSNEDNKMNWLIVGDSFNWKINDILWKNDITNQLSFLHYYESRFDYYSNTLDPYETKTMIDRSAIDWDNDILSNDVIVLSVVESNLLNLGHSFIDDLLGYYDGKTGKNIYNAKITVDQLSIQGKANKLLSISVSIENQSEGIWLVGDNSKIKLGAHWVDSDGKVTYDAARANLYTNMLPGQKQNITIEVNCPEKEGIYYLKVDMVEEGVCWFEGMGSNSVIIEIIVNSH